MQINQVFILLKERRKEIMSSSYYIGIDVGGTNVRIGIVEIKITSF